MSELITIGEPLVVFASKQPNVSLADATEFHKGIGGAELNVAIGSHRLGHSVQYVSQIGQEPLGKYISHTIQRLGIGTDYLFETNKYLTGHQFKQLVTHGDPDVANYRKSSAASHLQPSLVETIDLTDVKIAHLTGIYPAISQTALLTFQELVNQLIGKNILISFDTNLRPALWKSQEVMRKTINELASYADIVLPGINEGKILVGTGDPEKIADFYLNQGRTNTVIVKVGAKGAFVKTNDGIAEYVSGFKVKQVVDTVGAGDGFALGVITALLEKKPIQEAVLRGNAIGAMQVQTPGDNDGYPTREQLQGFYQKAGIQQESEVSKFVR
ncbi:sugar kinase [Lentilactobacillus parafarraginis]|jgi:2-dehydro-3-deoxygluconokinase|uniref:2-dehydro-3-deoxygluconokinase n=2 Tax=Lentilactobacillus parafarraginis TaxID=390842 RepID=A0A0R1YM93_9LACO|nr:sugar kinase [Lentilactobacillus parafarraginis]KRM42004.1 2-dehydro-3-deoxygluconokinase [Lentilactobacillus parafarraginis DSM 18390 = JCM 14109]TLQ19893.1 sugar kinase [Lentilactobacillus parafarraginis]